jgi:ketosteroid isomerase-like protein
VTESSERAILRRSGDTERRMSRENVDLVRAAYHAVIREDWDAAAPMFNPDAEFRGTVGGVEPDFIEHGLEQFRRFQDEDGEAWDERRFEPEEFIDAGDRVVVFQREFRRGRGSGIEVEAGTAVIFEVRDGQVVGVQGYMDRAAALEAAGLPGSPAGD